MPKPFTPKVVTANDLLDGDVVYLTVDSRWTRLLTEAEVLIDKTAAEARLDHARDQGHAIVGAYLADVTTDGAPTHFREEFRRTGPSNYHHGKQAELAHV